MNAAVQSALVSGVVGIVVLLLSQRANRRSEAATNALQQQKVDGENKAVDLSVLEASIADLEKRLGRAEGRVTDLEDELATEREARVVAMQRAEAAEARAEAAEARADQLEARVTQLEQTLREHDIAVPPVS